MDFNEVIPALLKRIEALEARVKKLEAPADDTPKPATARKGKASS